MRFSDSTQFNIPKPIKHAISDLFPFVSDESLTNEDSPQTSITPSTPSNYDLTTFSSNDSSSVKMYDHSPFKQMIKTPQTDISIDRSRHPSQDQSTSLPPPIDRTIETHHNPRRQPKLDFRLFTSPSKLYTQSITILAQWKLVTEKLSKQ